MICNRMRSLCVRRVRGESKEGRTEGNAIVHFKLLPPPTCADRYLTNLTSAWKSLRLFRSGGSTQSIFICDETLSCSDLTHIYKNIHPSNPCLLAGFDNFGQLVATALITARDPKPVVGFISLYHYREI